MTGSTDRAFSRLADRYAALADPVRRHGRTHPAAIEARFGGDIGSEVIPARAADARLLEAGRDHLDRQIESHPRMHDGEVLALDSAVAGGLVLRAGSYYETVATCDALRTEFERGGEMPLRAIAETLAAPDPLRIGAGRVAAVGVTVAVTFRTGGDGALLIGRRRPDLAADPGRWDVAPSGMVEPAPAGSEPIHEAAIREISEELGEGIADAGELRVLGLAFDLLRLKPDVVFELQLPRERFSTLTLSRSEFQSADRLDLTPRGFDRFWSDHGPDSLSTTGAATVALLEAR